MRGIIGSLFIATVGLGALQGCAPVVVAGAAAGGAVVAHDRRTAGTLVQDQMVEAKVYDEFGKVPGLHPDNSHIGVTSFNHIVLLTGQVSSQELAYQAVQIVRGVDKVRRVHNELTVGEPTPVSVRLKDTSITAAAKAALLRVSLPNFDPTRVKIVTEDGVVYLLGLVSREEADRATEEVRRVNGVKRVVRLFEYTNG